MLEVTEGQAREIVQRMVPGVPPATLNKRLGQALNACRAMNPARFEFEVLRQHGRAFDNDELTIFAE